MSSGTPLTPAPSSVDSDAAFTAKGDLKAGSDTSGAPTILPVGTNGEILVADSAEDSGLKWSVPASSDADFTAKGQIKAGTSVSGSPNQLSVGANGTVLVADSVQTEGLVWRNLTATDSTNDSDLTGTTVNDALDGLAPTAKGDILVATGAGIYTRLPVGADDEVLTADAAEASGLKWATAAGGGGGGLTLRAMSNGFGHGSPFYLLPNTMQTSGLFDSSAYFDTSSAVTQDINGGTYYQQGTSSTSGAFAGWESDPIGGFHRSKMVLSVCFELSTTSTQTWGVGLSDDYVDWCNSTTTPSNTNGVGLYFNSDRNATDIYICHRRNNVTSTFTSTGVALTSGLKYRYEIRLTGSSSSVGIAHHYLYNDETNELLYEFEKTGLDFSTSANNVRAFFAIRSKGSIRYIKTYGKVVIDSHDV